VLITVVKIAVGYWLL